MTCKYEECDTCRFNNEEPAICDICEDADQYEPDDEWEDDEDIDFGVNQEAA